MEVLTSKRLDHKPLLLTIGIEQLLMSKIMRIFIFEAYWTREQEEAQIIEQSC